MKALVYDGKETLNFRDMPDPTPADGEHLIKVAAVGICGSDMHAYHGTDARRPAPLILGHEAAGHIVGGDRDGERVTVNPLVTLQDNEYTRTGRENISPTRELLSMPPREGAFAQYLVAPAENLVTVPEGVPLAHAAMAEPLAVCWHAARLALGALHPQADRRALVIGGGAIGVGSARALAAMGIDDVTLVEPNAARCAFVRDVVGINAVTKVDEARFGLVIDAVGYAATRAAACAAIKPGGVIAHIGLGDGEGGLDIRYMTLQEITFIGTYCYTKADFKDTAEAIYDGRLGDMSWTEMRDLSDGAAAFKALDAGQVATPKIILDPWA